ncbi:CPBP family intramembrane glutamic endopeptidase [Paucisalibacillus sp. EB02]|uniref:CPBP family intramembrane glutamic endopeptidase n=1 Tax=Paucisalibacillus sp. EB02 TaxID=1347087 RepID=UPI0004BC6719|nr:CPBP family intramembrane glutamic endopeptidase [Paucisalibacillus sp. EB02]
MKQSEIIKQLTDQELRKSVVYSQLLFIIITLLVSFILFDSLTKWTSLVHFDIKEIVYFGMLPGIIIVVIDLIMISILPKKLYDDGGINKRIFSGMSLPNIFILTLLIAVSEELLFRGVVQTTFGYIIASLSFAFVHFRYLKKPVLLISIVFVSFLIGYMYEITGNLLVSITSHFIVDFLLGLVIRYKIWGD